MEKANEPSFLIIEWPPMPQSDGRSTAQQVPNLCEEGMVRFRRVTL